MQIDQEYEVVRLDGDHDPLREHPQNPRQGNVEAIDESIETSGWYGAVIAQKSTGYILAGNHRYRAAVARGATEIPVIWRDVDDETAVRILLGDNKIADLGGYDEELLATLLDSLDSLEGTGYSDVMARAEAVEAGGDEDDDVPEDRYEPEFGIMLVCESEEHQEALYEWLSEVMTRDLPGDAPTMRVVAV